MLEPSVFVLLVLLVQTAVQVNIFTFVTSHNCCVVYVRKGRMDQSQTWMVFTSCKYYCVYASASVWLVLLYEPSLLVI